jgi:hypothetical protein
VARAILLRPHEIPIGRVRGFFLLRLKLRRCHHPNLNKMSAGHQYQGEVTLILSTCRMSYKPLRTVVSERFVHVLHGKKTGYSRTTKHVDSSSFPANRDASARGTGPTAVVGADDSVGAATHQVRAPQQVCCRSCNKSVAGAATSLLQALQQVCCKHTHLLRLGPRHPHRRRPDECFPMHSVNRILN